MASETIAAFRAALIDTDKRLNAAKPRLYVTSPPAKRGPQKQAKPATPRAEQAVKSAAQKATSTINAYSNPIGTLLGLITSGPDDASIAEWRQYYGATMQWLDGVDPKSSDFGPELAKRLAEFQRLRQLLSVFVPGGFPAVAIPIPEFSKAISPIWWVAIVVALAALAIAAKFVVGDGNAEGQQSQ